jgi:hypothetical protein
MRYNEKKEDICERAGRKQRLASWKIQRRNALSITFLAEQIKNIRK